MDAQMETEEKLASELEDQVSKPLKEKLAELDAAVVRYHLGRSCPNSLAQPLRDRGIDVTTTPEVWLRKASDAEQLSYTHISHRILLTRDLDFLGLKQDPSRDHSGIFYLHPLHTPAEIVKLLTKIHEHMDASAVYFRVAGANNSIVRDARVLLASHWSRWRPTMRPYSMDLRERVAAAIDAGEGSQRQVAKRFRVSVSFVTRLVQRRRDAGTLAPKPHGGGPRPALGFPERVRLAMRIAEHPDATLKQLKEWGGFACTLTTLWRTLRRFRLTYKKKTLHAGERDTPEVQAKRRRYRAKVRRIEAKRLVFVDETGVNTAMTPTHAWARRGERAKGSVPSSWGSTTVIAALGLDGVRAPLVFPGATDTQAFQTYVDQVLVPELRPGDVVVFDNLKPHLSRHVAESIERAGATVLPLPPYSSDYDPIEELWSKFKGQLRRIAARTKDGLYKAVGETLDSVTIQDILGWFNHSGLYATHG